MSPPEPGAVTVGRSAADALEVVADAPSCLVKLGLIGVGYELEAGVDAPSCLVKLGLIGVGYELDALPCCCVARLLGLDQQTSHAQPN